MDVRGKIYSFVKDKYIHFVCLTLVMVLLYICIGQQPFVKTKVKVNLKSVPLHPDSTNERGYTKNVSTQDFAKTKKMYKIVWYAPPKWLKQKSNITRANCDFNNNCFVSFDKNDILNSDLVLFHHKDMNITSPVKIANQKWVFVTFESPYHTLQYYSQRQWMNKFDWTMSYRTTAEGYEPKGKIVPRKAIKQKNYTSIFEKKTKEIGWVVSHCSTFSKREKYVQKMRKIIDVDIFGRCGKPCAARKGIECKAELSKRYKFYLSFENSLCKDYITEKVFQIFNDDLDLIPIIRGAPNIKEVVPENTFISTQDFSSPENLALYLKEVGSNESLYSEILRTKDRFTVKHNYRRIGICLLCKRLNTDFEKRPKLRLQEAMSTNQCRLPNDI